MTTAQTATTSEAQDQQTVVVGLLAAPGLARDLADQIAQRLPSVLGQRVPNTIWQFVVRTEPLAAAASVDVDLVQLTRQRLLDEGWQFAVCLTDLPLRVGRRPVTAYASAPLGVGVVSIPAFGAVNIEDRVLKAVQRVVLGLVSGSDERRAASRRRRPRLRLTIRLRELSSPVGRPDDAGDGTLRYLAPAGPGNLRLLLGMVRANRPWRLIIGLSRALVAALGTGAFGLTSPPIWRIADAMSWVRVSALTLFSIAAIAFTLIVAHGLWERPASPAVRERVRLVNIATMLTIVLGVLTLFAALLVITTVCDTALLLPPVMQHELGHEPRFDDYLRVAWVVSCMATLGGALGAVVESDVAVREAAYGYRAADRAGSDDGRS